jgi:hypothetical protein
MIEGPFFTGDLRLAMSTRHPDGLAGPDFLQKEFMP